MAARRVLTTQARAGTGYRITTDNAGSINFEAEEESGGSALTNLTNVVFLDAGTPVAVPDQTGNDQLPFSTLAAAIAAVATNGGTIQIVPGDYSGEGGGTLAANSARAIVFNNFAGTAPPASGIAQRVLLPTLTGTAAKIIQGCTTINVTSTQNVSLDGCIVNGQVTGLALRVTNCALVRSTTSGYTFTGTTFFMRDCDYSASGKLANLSGGSNHYILNTKFSGTGSGDIDFASSGIMNFDGYSAATFFFLYGVPFSEIGNPQTIESSNNRLKQVSVPSLLAGVLAYVDVDVSVTGLPAIPEGTAVLVNPTEDVGTAGAGGGFVAQARVSADDRVRIAIVGATTSAEINMLFTFP